MGAEQSEPRGRQGFAIRMPDYAAPAFCTFSREYVGTPAMLRDYVDARKKLDPDFRVTDVLCEVTILAVKEICMAPFQWNHMNVWDCVYHIRAGQCEVKLAYIKMPDIYCRCVLAEFWNPAYDGRPLNGRFWGQPAMLVYEGVRLRNRLMYLEKCFQSETKMLADIVHPSEVDFTGFFEDVFGDG